MKKRYAGIHILFYVLAVLFLLYSVYAGWFCLTYISVVIASGQIAFTGNEFTVLSYYMTNVGSYLFYAVSLFGIGYLIAIQQRKLARNLSDPILAETFESPSCIEDNAEEPLEGFSVVIPKNLSTRS